VGYLLVWVCIVLFAFGFVEICVCKGGKMCGSKSSSTQTGSGDNTNSLAIDKHVEFSFVNCSKSHFASYGAIVLVFLLVMVVVLYFCKRRFGLLGGHCLKCRSSKYHDYV